LEISLPFFSAVNAMVTAPPMEVAIIGSSQGCKGSTFDQEDVKIIGSNLVEGKQNDKFLPIEKVFFCMHLSISQGISLKN